MEDDSLNPARSIGDLLRRPARLFGREAELEALAAFVADREGPVLLQLHGLPGVGKSALLAAAAALLGDEGRPCRLIDGRMVEPTAQGILDALEGPVEGGALLIDHFDSLRLLDGWFRREFLPSLPASVRVVLAGVEPLGAPWTLEAGWAGLVRTREVGPLAATAADDFLAELGVEAGQRATLIERAHGHPLALRMLAETPVERAPADAALTPLSRAILARSEELRPWLEAASAVRRLTQPILRALDCPDPEAVYRRLEASALMEALEDGLSMREPVRRAVAGAFRASDPERFRRCRTTAWRLVREDLRRASDRRERWRASADTLFLVDEPTVRQAFFPDAAPPAGWEAARAEHGDAVLEMVRRHRSPTEAALIALWWRQARDAFLVLPGEDGPAAFYILGRPEHLARVAADPVAAAWRELLVETPLPRGQTALFVRMILSAATGFEPSPAQAGAWLDVKRTYLELHPALRRVYLLSSEREAALYSGPLNRLGFELLRDRAGGPVQILVGDEARETFVLDMGPASLDGWFAQLLGLELNAPEAGFIDLAGRRARLPDGESVDLTRKEFELLQFLAAAPGVARSRDEILDQVWGLPFGAGSNVVDAVVRDVRRKLGPQLAARVEAVRGVGYRLSAG
ncbi:MAG: winged helix-turn-helix domain-containing protein [Proteobacteria bacterium]|nr:winged helix-turn-helix domain-containing protein [Pseudomonadota bacterium]